MLSSMQSKNVYLLLAQVDAWKTPHLRLELCRRLVLSKLASQRALLQRHALDHASQVCSAAVERLAALEQQALTEPGPDELRGIEGAGAAVYFEAFGELLTPPWTFPGRVRRPPTDPVNALLSFGYTLATAEVVRLLLRGGFDSRIGVLHGLRYGRESLALDLVEELRTPLVDRFVLRQLNLRQFKPTDFETQEDGAVRMSDDARRDFLERWEELMMSKAPRTRRRTPAEVVTSTRLAKPDDEAEPSSDEAPETTTWRYRMEQQVNNLRRFLLEGAEFETMNDTILPSKEQ